MTLTLDSDVKARMLDTRVANLEKAIQVNGNTLTIQVGSSKIVISPNEIRLETNAAINIRCTGNLNVESTSSGTLKAGSKLTIRGSTVDIN